MFDEEASFAGSWRLDAVMSDLAADRYEAILIAVPNAGGERITEYSPRLDHTEAKGDAYIDFLTNVAKPFVDATLHTDASSKATGLIGSSLGANISLHGFFSRPDIYGLCAALSPALWHGGDHWTELARTWRDGGGRLYVDMGGREATDDPVRNQQYIDGYQLAVASLRNAGYDPSRLMTVFDSSGTHDERAWGTRAPAALRFLLADS